MLLSGFRNTIESLEKKRNSLGTQAEGVREEEIGDEERNHRFQFKQKSRVKRWTLLARNAGEVTLF